MHVGAVKAAMAHTQIIEAKIALLNRSLSIMPNSFVSNYYYICIWTVANYFYIYVQL